MSLDDFIRKYDGKKVEAGGSPGAMYQCVDLANQWLSEGLGLSKILGADAVDFPSRAMDICDWIPNMPEGVPGKGDLVVWDMGSYGHIAIFVSGNANAFTSFDQNYPSGSLSHLQNHNYNNVIGWLRPEGVSMSDPYQDLAWFERHKENVRNLYQTILLRPPENEQVVENYARSNSDIKVIELNFRVGASLELTKNLANTRKEITGLKSTYNTLVMDKNIEIGDLETIIFNKDIEIQRLKDKTCAKMTYWDLFVLIWNKIKNWSQKTDIE